MASVNQIVRFQSFAVGVFLVLSLNFSFGQGTAFLYQGQLNSGSGGANGHYDLEFNVFDAVTNGDLISGPLTNYDVPVSNGLFTTTVDFGQGVFNGSQLWLGIGVRTNGTAAFTLLWPRQPVLPVPYAIFANSASNVLGAVSASQLTGGSTNVVALTNGANLFSGTFSGNGGAVTNVNVTNLTGVLADSQLPTNTVYLNSNQTFTANNTFNGSNNFTNLYGNSFSGSFFGNGLVGWVVVPGTSVQASSDHGYLLTNSQTVTVTLPLGPNVGDIVRIAGAGANGWQLAQNTNQSVLGNFFNYGSGWAQDQQYEEWTSLASSSDGTMMAATAYGGEIYLSTDSGQAWVPSANSGTKDWESIASSAEGTHLAAGVTSGGDIYLSTNSGSTWAPISASAGYWYSLASSSDGSKLIAASYGYGLSNFVNGVFTFGYSTGANDWRSVASSANGSNLVAAFYGGSLYTSTNAGAKWTPAAGTSGSNWIAVVSSADGTRLAAAVDGGDIDTSANSGVSWAATSAPKESWVSLACSSDGSKLVAVASSGGLFTSGNWGATWTQQTNNLPASASWQAVTSSSTGSTLAAAIDNGTTTSGGIYYSSQGSSTLTSSTPGTNGYVAGPQGSAVELQYIGNNQFMPVSVSGTLWAQ